MLINYLPQFMQEIKEMQVIMNVSEPFIQDINLETENSLKDMYILEATENGVSHYEKMLGITPKLTENLEDRKSRILLKYNEKLPYTYKNLILMLDTICGEGNYTINLSFENLTLTIRIRLSTKALLETVSETLERVVPVNIFIDLDLLYNTWGNLSEYKWKNLAQKTWKELKESEINEANR